MIILNNHSLLLLPVKYPNFKLISVLCLNTLVHSVKPTVPDILFVWKSHDSVIFLYLACTLISKDLMSHLQSQFSV